MKLPPIHTLMLTLALAFALVATAAAQSSSTLTGIECRNEAGEKIDCPPGFPTTVTVTVEPPKAPLPPQNIFAAGVSGNIDANTPVAGTAMYARRFTDQATYSFTVLDILPNSGSPGTITTSISSGLAQRVLMIGKASAYLAGSAGIGINGQQTDVAWTAGGLLSIPIGTKGLRVMPNFRVVRSNTEREGEYRPTLGVMVGWGSSGQ